MHLKNRRVWDRQKLASKNQGLVYFLWPSKAWKITFASFRCKWWVASIRIPSLEVRLRSKYLRTRSSSLNKSGNAHQNPFILFFKKSVKLKGSALLWYKTRGKITIFLSYFLLEMAQSHKVKNPDFFNPTNGILYFWHVNKFSRFFRSLRFHEIFAKDR